MVVKELFVKLGLDIDESGFRKADSLLGNLKRGFEEAIGRNLFELAKEALHSLFEMVDGTAEAADHIKKLAQSTGVDSIALQEFGYSAELAGVSIDEMAQGLRHLAKTGVKDVKAEVLRLAEQFQKMPDDGRKVELAMEKMGKSGARLIPWLNGGKEALADLAQEAHDLGVIFDEEAQASAEEYKDNITRLHKAFEGIRNLIGNKVIPIFNKLVLGGLKLFREIRANWVPIVEKLTAALRILAVVLGGVLLGALLANVGAIALNASWYAALGVASVIAGAKALAAWLAVIAPITLLGLLIAALVLGLQDFYVFLTGGDSLIGEMVPKWNKFLDTILETHEDDWWLIKALKKALSLILRTDDVLQKMFKVSKQDLENPEYQAADNAVTRSGFAKWVKGALGGGKGWDVEQPAAMSFGGGASPAASVASSPSVGVMDGINAALMGKPGNVSVTAPITINQAPGQDPQQMAETFAEHINKTMREAQAVHKR